MPSFTISPVSWADPAGFALRAAQRAELDARYGGDSEPGTKPSEADIAVFLLCHLEGSAIGCGGLRPLDSHAAELKRMYVVPEHRGSGAADAILAAIETEAIRFGYTQLRLETGLKQPDAMAFYRRNGYQPIPNFGPYVGSPSSVCLEKRVAG